MKKIAAWLFVTLDGVMESPEQWVTFDDQMGEAVDAEAAAADTLLLGRRTYEVFADSWPYRSSADDPMADWMNTDEAEKGVDLPGGPSEGSQVRLAACQAGCEPFVQTSLGVPTEISRWTEEIPTVAGNIEEHSDATVGLAARGRDELDPGRQHLSVGSLEVIDAEKEADTVSYLLPDNRRLVFTVSASK